MPAKLTSLVALLLAISVIGTAATTLGQQGSDAITGDALACPDGSSVLSEFRLENDAFSVTGLLVSLDAQSVAVTGPTGDVTAALTVNAEGDPGLQPGTPATVEGALFDQGTSFVASEIRSACNGGTDTPQPSPSGSPTDTPIPGDASPTPTPTPMPEPGDMPGEAVCNRGPGRGGELHLIIHGDRVDIKPGTVASSAEGLITVMTPFGELPVMIDDSAKVKGDLASATEVWVKGMLADDGVHADQVKVLCPHEAHQDDDDDDGGDDDVDPTETPTAGPVTSNGRPHRPVRATPAVPAIPAVPGEPGDPATPAVSATPAVPPMPVASPNDNGGQHGNGGSDNGNQGNPGNSGNQGNGGNHGHGGNKDD